jgi:predicted ArsR family transcriptional regulator
MSGVHVTVGDLGKRFEETTRGRVIALIRRGTQTVEELAQALGLSDNAIRSHLSTLERDGLVRQAGIRRGEGPGKPATLYAIDPAAEPLFSRAYAPVMAALVEEIAEQLPEASRDELMQGLGRRLAANMGRAPRGNLAARVEAAAELLDSLGGVTQVERKNGTLVIRGRAGCPLSAATTHGPELCRALGGFLTEYVGAPVVACCARGERPCCHFEVRDAPTAA